MTGVSFKVGEYVVYPAHGVGKITNIEFQSLAGMSVELLVIKIIKDNISLSIPVKKAERAGLRHLLSKTDMEKVIDILQSRPKSNKGMWSRRSVEYDNKINSGDLLLISEIVRDLYKNSENTTDRSYSERVVFETALERITLEYAVINKLSDLAEAKEKILSYIREKQVA